MKVEVPRPTKVIGVGLNYRSHAAEMGAEIPREPVLFMKPSTTVIGPGAVIPRPLWPDGRPRRIDHEAELAVVFAERAKDVPAERWRDVVLGFTCANDVTARDLQKEDGQWTRAKSFDGFCPLGPHVETDLDVTDLAVECRVNGERRQAGRTSDLLFGVPALIEHVTRVMTILPGDVLLTGTPAGIGPLQEGDVVEVRVEGIGVLANPFGKAP